MADTAKPKAAADDTDARVHAAEVAASRAAVAAEAAAISARAAESAAAAPRAAAAPTRSAALPPMDDEAWDYVKAWVRREIELARAGNSPEQRASALNL